MSTTKKYDRPIVSDYKREMILSEISDEIADLNFQSFDGDDENELDNVFTLLIPEPEHNNNGTLSCRTSKPR